MAVFENPWKSMMNYAVVNDTASNASKNQLWAIKAFLTGQIGGATAGLWTVIRSSDGSSVADSDLWGDTFDASKLNRAAAGSAHSWIVLRSAHAIPVYLILDYCSTQADSWFMAILSYAAPTGGAVTTRPTATDEHLARRDTWGANDHQLNNNDGAAPGQLRVHAGLSSTGDFWVLGSKDGNGKFTFAMFCVTVTDAKPTDTRKTLLHIETYRTLGLCEPFGGSYNGGKNGLLNPLSFDNPSDLGTFTGAWAGRSHDGTAVLTATAVMPGFVSGNIAHSYLFHQPETYPPVLGGTDAVDGYYDDFPIYLVGRQGSAFTLKGRLQDFRWASCSAGHGRVEPVDGPPFSSMICGAVWIPGVNAAPVL